MIYFEIRDLRSCCHAGAEVTDLRNSNQLNSNRLKAKQLEARFYKQDAAG